MQAKKQRHDTLGAIYGSAGSTWHKIVITI